MQRQISSLIPRRFRRLNSAVCCLWSSIFIISSVFSNALSQTNRTDYYTPERILAFAEWLYHVDHDYTRAGDEYARYLFLVENPNDSVQFRLAMCRKREGKLSIADELFDRAALIDSCSVWRSKAVFHSAHISFLQGNYTNSLGILARELGVRCNFEPARFRQLQVFDLLAGKQWDAARAAIDTGKSYLTNEEELTLRTLLEVGKALPHTNPLVAGCLSALVPGLGKVYTSEWQDGVYSFIYVALTGYLSYTGFHSAGLESWKGWIFGTLSATLYAGNIYGSAKSAAGFNIRVNSDFLKNIKHLCEGIGIEE